MPNLILTFQICALTFSTAGSISASDMVSGVGPTGACSPVIAMARKTNALKKYRINLQHVGADGTSSEGEQIYVDSRLFVRMGRKPWQIINRPLTQPTAISNCEFNGTERLNGASVKVYDYDRRDSQTLYRVRTWIDDKTGLQLKSHWKEIEPNIIRNERILNFLYDSNIRQPI